MSDRRLFGKTAIVTGGARGMGRSMCVALAANGARVIVADINLEGAESVARAIGDAGGAAEARRVDVANQSDVEAMVDSVDPAPDVLVCNAGITSGSGRPPAFPNVSEGDWDRIIAVNLGGAFHCAQATARRLARVRKPGSFILISSLGVARPNAGGIPYHASKGGVDALVRALAVELASISIRVNGIAPGYMLTDMTREAFQVSGAAERVCERVPMRRLGSEHDLDGVCVFLASDEAAYITGQMTYVDGGAGAIGCVAARPLVTVETGGSR